MSCRVLPCFHCLVCHGLSHNGKPWTLHGSSQMTILTHLYTVSLSLLCIIAWHSQHPSTALQLLSWAFMAPVPFFGKEARPAGDLQTSLPLVFLGSPVRWTSLPPASRYQWLVLSSWEAEVLVALRGKKLFASENNQKLRNRNSVHFSEGTQNAFVKGVLFLSLRRVRILLWGLQLPHLLKLPCPMAAWLSHWLRMGRMPGRLPGETF